MFSPTTAITRKAQLNTYGKRVRKREPAKCQLSDENIHQPAGNNGLSAPIIAKKVIKKHQFTARLSASPLHVPRISSNSSSSPYSPKLTAKERKQAAFQTYRARRAQVKTKAAALPRLPLADVLNSPAVARRGADYFAATPAKPVFQVDNDSDFEDLPQYKVVGIKGKRKVLSVDTDEEDEFVSSAMDRIPVKNGSRKHPIVLSSDLSSTDRDNQRPVEHATPHPVKSATIKPHPAPLFIDEPPSPHCDSPIPAKKAKPKPKVKAKVNAAKIKAPKKVAAHSPPPVVYAHEPSLTQLVNDDSATTPSLGPLVPTSSSLVALTTDSDSDYVIQKLDKLSISSFSPERLQPTPPTSSALPRPRAGHFLTPKSKGIPQHLSRPVVHISPRRTRTKSMALQRASGMAKSPFRASPLRMSMLPSKPLKGIMKVVFPSEPVTAALAVATGLEKAVAKLSLSSQPTAAVVDDIPKPVQSFNDTLKPLLVECQQNVPMDFEYFVSTLPTEDFWPPGPDPVFHSKIGEATYSEVFGCGDKVLKVVPLRNPFLASPAAGVDEDDWPTESDVAEVTREISTTTALGELSGGFVKLVKAYIVTGRYPKRLVKLWETFKKKRGAENVHPGCFSASQHYAVIVLPNGGPDLETYDFKKSKVHTKQPWRKAWSIFWQVVQGLERAEDLAGFEHRDLHWGQILVKDVEPSGLQTLGYDKGGSTSLANGVKVTIIDLGLARMDGYGDEQRWTEFDPLIFEGEGDYQYDIYRMMRAHNGGEWSSYKPLTNVMWLHYLAVKLLKAKQLRPPPKAKQRSNERICYEHMVDMEKLLEENVKTRACRTIVTRLRSAGDVWKLGIAEMWVC